MAAVTITAEGVASRAAEVRRRIAEAGGDPDAVTIVAVTKGFGAEAVTAAHGAGLPDVGENYAQELLAKAVEVGSLPGLRWHFVGAVQRNKVGALGPLVATWQSVDRAEEAAAIARAAPAARILVQVNLSGEPQKAGCRFDELDGVIAAARADGLDVAGLMGVGPAGEPEAARPHFAALAAAARARGLAEVSMGMTADLEVAVQEGATMVRVGTALFGPRPRALHVRR